MTQTIIPAGTLLSITTGEYSDYMVQGVFRTLKDLDPHSYREAYLVQNPEQRKQYHFNDHQFIAELTRDGFLEPVPCTELHIGNYCDGELTINTFGGMP